MIDSIKLWISAEEAVGVDLMAELPLKLNGMSTTADDITGKIMIKGYLASLFVIVTENGVCLSGSLSKYYYGSNMYTLSFTEIQEAFKRIETELAIPIEKFRVQRLDIAENFVVDYPVRNYYKYLGGLNYYKRQEMNNGIYYNGSNQTMLFYDKVYERKVRRESVLEDYIGKNVFRYELKFQRRLGKLFNRQYVFVRDLLDESFFRDLLERYKMQFQQIYKHRVLVHYGGLQINDRSEFWNQIKVLGIHALGGERILLQTVMQARKDKVFKNSMHATRLIKDIKNAYRNVNFSEYPELIKELENTIFVKLNNYLAIGNL